MCTQLIYQQSRSEQVEAVAGLSILELFLLVALCRLTRKGVSTPNFQMAFDEYSSLRRGGSYRGVDETASKPSAFRAFERLLSASLVAYTDARCLNSDWLSVQLNLHSSVPQRPGGGRYILSFCLSVFAVPCSSL